MEQVYKNLYVGGDIDYDRLKSRSDFWFVRCCKEGPGGHRDTLGYHTLGAPKDKNYYYVLRGKKLALNLLDLDDPNHVPDIAIDEALRFINKQLNSGHKVLVACNQGKSRGPTVAMLYLRSINDLPESYSQGYKIFSTIYDKYDPGKGMLGYAKLKYNNFRYGNIVGY